MERIESCVSWDGLRGLVSRGGGGDVSTSSLPSIFDYLTFWKLNDICFSSSSRVDATILMVPAIGLFHIVTALHILSFRRKP